ncbi:MAG: glycosyltransferase family 39 protein [Bacteroidota bacterium]
MNKRPGGYIFLLAAGLLALWPAFLFYLLVLEPSILSRLRIGIAVLLVPLFAWPFYMVLSRAAVPSWRSWVLIGLGSAVLALFGLQALSFYGGRLYPFYGRHTLALAAPSQAFEIRGLQTSVGPVSYSAFQGLEGWDRRGGRLLPLSPQPGLLQWSGWTGDFARLDVSGEPGTPVEVSWDGRKQVYEIQPDARGVFSIQFRVPVPGWGKVLLFLVLGLVLFYLISLFYLAGAARPGSDLPAVPGPWRIALLAAVLMGLGVLLLWVYLRIHPAFLFPDRDSGFFMYSGRQILEGKIPYRDFWDHKGPLIFYIDALGLWLGGNTAAAVWALELVWTSASVLCLFFLLRRVAGDIAAAVGCILLLIGLKTMMAGGNFTEDYGLLLTTLALAGFWLFSSSGRLAWLLLSGLASAAAFLMLPSRISAGLGIGIYLLAVWVRSRFSRRELGSILIFGLAFTAPVLLYALYLAVEGAFADMISALFVFNRMYVGGLQWNLLEGFSRGLYGFHPLGLWVTAGAAALYARLLVRRKGPEGSFAVVVAISAAAELYLSNLSRSGFRHYYIAWLPYAACLAAYFTSDLLSLPGWLLPRWRAIYPRLIYAAAFLAALAGIWKGSTALWAKYYPLDWMAARPVWDTPAHSVDRLRAYLQPDSELLMWGHELSYNFILDREAPGRFVHQYALMRPPYATPALVQEFLGDLRSAMPVIVDASGGNPDAIPLDFAARTEFLSLPGNQARFSYLRPLYDFIDTHYRRAGEISRDWVVLLPVR